MKSLKYRPPKFFDYLAIVLVAFLWFISPIVVVIHLLNLIFENSYGLSRLGQQVLVLVIWGSVFGLNVNSFIAGFRRRWRETHDGRRGNWL